MKASRFVTTAMGATVVLLLVMPLPVQAIPTPSVAFVSVGYGPGDALYDQRNGEIYVLNLLDNTVSILDGSTNAVLRAVPAGGGPDVAAFDLANGNVYVTDVFTNEITVLNGSTGATAATISVGPSTFPQGITYDNQNGFLYVVNSGPLYNATYQIANTVSVINGSNNSLVATIPDTFAPLNTSYLIADVYDPQTGFVYISDEGHGIQVFNPASNAFIADIVTPANYGVAYDQVNGAVYALGPAAGSQGAPTIGVVDTLSNAISHTIALPASCAIPGSGTVDLRNGLLYIACFGTPNTVAVFDPSTCTVVQDFPVGGSEFFTVGGAFDLKTGAIYIPVPSTNATAVISP